MTDNQQRLRTFRRQIPAFDCKAGCHDCCGPVTASAEEMAQLPGIDDAGHETALAEWNCPYLGDDGCQVYAERPLICRLFGTTPRLPCPNGMRPAVMIDPRVAQRIFQFLAETRQVLL